MDITAVRASQDALFAEMMGTAVEESARQQQQPIRLQPHAAQIQQVEKRAKKRRDRDTTLQRPQSMTTFPSGSAYARFNSLQQQAGQLPADHGSSPSLMRAGCGGGTTTAAASHYPFSKPKAFFSSDQHLPAKVESYNRSHEGLFQLRASQVSQDRDHLV